MPGGWDTRTMIHPTQVLPSNAPPLNADVGLPSRVLQEDSGNRQYQSYSYHGPAEQKYRPSLLTENNYHVHHPVQQPLHVYRHTPTQRPHQRFGQSRHHGGNTDPSKKDKIARYLYHRFRSSDQYLKYRERQHKESKNGEQKWPDRLELAFFQALVHWPPMGRRKLPHKEKLRGRNELISDCIMELTGESRDRKQVSSHIQVLKPFVKGDHFIMRWLSIHDAGHDHNRLYSGYGLASSGGRRASSYLVAPTIANALPSGPLMSRKELLQIKSATDLLEPTEFSMFVQRKHDEIEVERLHTYTESITSPLQRDQQVPDWQSLQQEFPVLHSLHQRRPLDCQILLAETSLAFPKDNFKDQHGIALPGVELGISFLCSSKRLPVHAQIRCQNTFYKDGHLLDSSPNDVRLAQSDNGGGVETQLKFGSTFWARTLASVATKLNSPTDLDKAREDVDQHVRGITALQEIVVMTDDGPERLLIIYWRFRLSTSETNKGRAYWMRLLLPPSPESFETKSERVDSLFDYGLDYTVATASHHAQTSQPGLQSPFEYDASSGSALTSATWPASFDEPSTAAQSVVDWNGDNAFDFDGGNISISYDPNLDFSTLDSSAFNFDDAADFAADPILQTYSQDTHDFSQSTDHSQSLNYATPWCDSYTTSFEVKQPSTGVEHFPVMSVEPQSHGFDAYNQYDQSFNIRSDSQAFSGAGDDVVKEEEDPLVALADASYLASVTELPHHEYRPQ